MELALARDQHPYLEQAQGSTEPGRQWIAEAALPGPQRVPGLMQRGSAWALVQPLQVPGLVRERKPAREFESAGLEQALRRARLQELRLDEAEE